MSLRWQFRTCTIPSRWRVTGALSVLWEDQGGTELKTTVALPTEPSTTLAARSGPHTLPRSPGSGGLTEGLFLSLHPLQGWSCGNHMRGEGRAAGHPPTSPFLFPALAWFFSSYQAGPQQTSGLKGQFASSDVKARPFVIKQNYHIQKVQGEALIIPLKPKRAFTRHLKHIPPERTGIMAIYLPYSRAPSTGFGLAEKPRVASCNILLGTGDNLASASDRELFRMCFVPVGHRVSPAEALLVSRQRSPAGQPQEGGVQLGH